MAVSAEPRTAGEEADGHSKVGKHSWTPEEDEKLMAAVTKYGACRWSMIAMHVASGRVGKQCRERWNNHLCPDVKKSEWSDAEDLAILQGVADRGTRWCEIVQTAALAGRTDNAIKNRFYALQRRSKAAHAVAARAAAASARQASPLGKRRVEGGGAAAIAADEKEGDASLRDKVMSIATAIACSTDEAERDRLIRALAATLHPRAALPERATPAKAKGHGGSNRRPSPLSRTRPAAADDNELTSDLTAYLGADGHCCPSSPTPSFDSTCSPSGDDAPSSFRSDSSDAEDDADLFAYALGDALGDARARADEHAACATADISWAESAIATIPTPTLAAGPTGGRGADVDDTATDAAAAPAAAAAAATITTRAAAAAAAPTTTTTAAAAAPPTTSAAAKCLAYGGLAASVAAAAIRDGWHAAATGTEEPSAAAVAMGGRHKHRAMLAPLELPDHVAGGDASSRLSPIASLLSATGCSRLLSAVSSEREDDTDDAPASAKRQRTPCGWAEAATPPPSTHASVGATATGTEEPGAPAPTLALGASAAAATSVADDAALGPAPLGAALLDEASAATAGLPAAMAPSAVSQMQLSYFTDLFVKDGAAAVATGAAAAAPMPATTTRRRGRSAGMAPTRDALPTPLRMAAPSPLVSSPLVPRAAEPWRATRRARHAAVVG